MYRIKSLDLKLEIFPLDIWIMIILWYIDRKQCYNKFQLREKNKVLQLRFFPLMQQLHLLHFSSSLVSLYRYIVPLYFKHILNVRKLKLSHHAIKWTQLCHILNISKHFSLKVGLKLDGMRASDAVSACSTLEMKPTEWGKKSKIANTSGTKNQRQ